MEIGKEAHPCSITLKIIVTFGRCLVSYTEYCIVYVQSVLSLSIRGMAATRGLFILTAQLLNRRHKLKWSKCTFSRSDL